MAAGHLALSTARYRLHPRSDHLNPYFFLRFPSVFHEKACFTVVATLLLPLPLPVTVPESEVREPWRWRPGSSVAKGGWISEEKSRAGVEREK
jgi:hypothetical protein